MQSRKQITLNNFEPIFVGKKWVGWFHSMENTNTIYLNDSDHFNIRKLKSLFADLFVYLFYCLFKKNISRFFPALNRNPLNLTFPGKANQCKAAFYKLLTLNMTIWFKIRATDITNWLRCINNWDNWTKNDWLLHYPRNNLYTQK